MKNKIAICFLNKESVDIKKHFEQEFSVDYYCFDSISGQNVKSEIDFCKDISESFIYKSGFIQTSFFSQLKSFCLNYHVFNEYLKSYDSVIFSFENIFVRHFLFKNKFKHQIFINSVLHDERKPFFLRCGFNTDNLKIQILHKLKFLRKFLIGVFLPGLTGSSFSKKYIVNDQYTYEVLLDRIQPQVDIELNKIYPKHKKIETNQPREIIFISSAWLYHLKFKEHNRQIKDIILLKEIIKNKYEFKVKLHPRDDKKNYSELEKYKIKYDYYSWEELLNINNIYFSNLSTSIIELKESGYNIYSLMINFPIKCYKNYLIKLSAISKIEIVEELKKIIDEN